MSANQYFLRQEALFNGKVDTTNMMLRARLMTIDDIPAVYNVQVLCYPIILQETQETLTNRFMAYPQGSFVMQYFDPDDVCGAVTYDIMNGHRQCIVSYLQSHPWNDIHNAPALNPSKLILLVAAIVEKHKLSKLLTLSETAETKLDAVFYLHDCATIVRNQGCARHLVHLAMVCTTL